MATLYWYKTGADNNWDTLTGNWWTDSGHTSQAGALPTATDACILLGPIAPAIDADDGIFAMPASIDGTGLTGGAMLSAHSTEGNAIDSVSILALTGDLIFPSTGSNNVHLTNTFPSSISGDLHLHDASNASYATVGGSVYRYNSSTTSNLNISGNSYGYDMSYGGDGAPDMTTGNLYAFDYAVLSDNTANSVGPQNGVGRGSSDLCAWFLGNVDIYDTATIGLHDDVEADGTFTMHSSGKTYTANPLKGAVIAPYYVFKGGSPQALQPI